MQGMKHFRIYRLERLRPIGKNVCTRLQALALYDKNLEISMEIPKISAIFLLILVPGWQVVADLAVPLHSCLRPNKPAQFDSQAQLDVFNQEVEQYQVCINDFVLAQNRAIENHQAASVNALTEWNLFVETELQ
jgi:hypothetical protein